MMTATLKSGTVVEVDGCSTAILLPDGRIVEGRPQRTAEQAATAGELGYGDDVEAMVADHDPMHALLCDWLAIDVSPALFGTRTAEVRDAEEAAVLAVQKFMRLARGRMPYPRRASMSVESMREALVEAVALLKCHRFPDEAARRSIEKCERALLDAARVIAPHPSHRLDFAVCRSCYLDSGDAAIAEPCHPDESEK